MSCGWLASAGAEAACAGGVAGFCAAGATGFAGGFFSAGLAAGAAGAAGAGVAAGGVCANASGAVLWSLLVDGATRAELATALQDRYGIDRDRAEADADRFVAALESRGLLRR